MNAVAQRHEFRDQVIADTPGGERICWTACSAVPAAARAPTAPTWTTRRARLFALINAGEREQVLASNTMWHCVSCYLCTTRCPQKIPITDLMYTLKRMSIAEQGGTEYGRRRAGPLVHRLRGPLRSQLRVRPGQPLLPDPQAVEPAAHGAAGPVDVPQGPHVVDPVAHPPDSSAAARSSTRPRNWEERGRIVKYALLSGLLAGKQQRGLRDVARSGRRQSLGSSFETIDDWNCCGATEYHTHRPARRPHAVIARNLALVAEHLDQVVAPCSACYLNLKKTDRVMAEHPEMGAQGQPGPGRGRAVLRRGTTARSGTSWT